MDSSASLFSPSSSPPSSSFTFSSPVPPSPCSPSCSSCCSSAPSFSFSPRPLTSSSVAARRIPGDENPSPWDAPQPLRESFLAAQPPPRRRRPPPPQAAAAAAAPTHYGRLGVPVSATPAEIRVAYRKLALLHHPDVSTAHQVPAATHIFAEINEAYTTLTDPQKRHHYDLQLALGPSSATSASSSSPRYASPSSSSPRYSTSASASPRYSTSSTSTSPRYAASAAASPRQYTDATTGRVYPSMNSFYREWRNSHRV